MNVYKIYYDDVIHIRVLDIECDNYTEEARIKIEHSVASKIKNNVSKYFFENQDGVIGYSRIPTNVEREKENRSITITLDEKHLN